MENTAIAPKAAVTDNAFVSHNNVHLCGKIIRIEHPRKNETKFMISCSHKKNVKTEDSETKKQDKNETEYDLIGVLVFNDVAKFYETRFMQGDFVTVNGVVQTIRDHYNGTNYVEIWGLAMGPKFVRGKMIKDHNQVHIRGKITSSTAMSDNYILLNVLTSVEKSHPNPNKDSERQHLTATYKSITPVGIRCHGNAKELVKQYTEGTWVDCSGFIDDKVVDRGEFKKRVYRFVSLKTVIIGEVQKVFPKPERRVQIF